MRCRAELNGSFQESQFIAGIVAFAVELERVDRAGLRSRSFKRIGELDFAARSRPTLEIDSKMS